MPVRQLGKTLIIIVICAHCAAVTVLQLACVHRWLLAMFTAMDGKQIPYGISSIVLILASETGSDAALCA